MQDILENFYMKMSNRFGPQHWWPAETPFEVMVGAVLTQNTNWTNVEKAVSSLKEAGVLDLESLAALPLDCLAGYIRPAGYYNVKAKRLHNLCQCIREVAEGDVGAFLVLDPVELRQILLSVKGIGPETADSILLYAAEQPFFVVDAYTFRIFHRHQLLADAMTYNELQELFMENLPHDVEMFNEFHALLVRVGKQYCRKSKPLCTECPLQEGDGWIAAVEE